MRRFGSHWLAAMLLSAMCCAAMAADKPPEDNIEPQRYCTEADLAGTYVLVEFHEKPEGLETHLHEHSPYQYIGFYPNKLYAILAINTEMKTPQSVNKFLAPNGKTPSNGQKYTLGPDGALYLYSGSKLRYSYRCIANLKDNGDYRKGDLIITGYAGKSHNELYNLYRHWY